MTSPAPTPDLPAPDVLERMTLKAEILEACAVANRREYYQRADDEAGAVAGDQDRYAADLRTLLSTAREAARLRAENERLRSALTPFARIADQIDGIARGPTVVTSPGYPELVAARAALGQKP